MLKFGDLSGFVLNVRDNTLLSGNQKQKVFPPDSVIKIEKKYAIPTRCKTVAEGYVVIDGERFKYREVDADKTWATEAMIAANKHGGDWDFEVLKRLMVEVPNIEVAMTGFELNELQDLKIPEPVYDPKAAEETEKENKEREKPEPKCGEDEVPPTPKESKVKRGEVWLLGNHRLMCGDSTSKEDVEKLMGGEKADMVFTSPPYNADTLVGDGDIFTSKKSKKLYSDGYSDNLTSSDYVSFARDVLDISFQCTDGFIFWNVSYNKNSRFEYIQQITEKLEYLIEQVCWKKSSTIPFKGSLMRDWEPVYIFSTNKKSLGLDAVTSNHWEISNTHSQQEEHKACFPVQLPEKAISLIKSRSGIVFEPFCGSGSTLIACEKTNRRCFGMEIDPVYCQVIIDRWEKYTGKVAIKKE